VDHPIAAHGRRALPGDRVAAFTLACQHLGVPYLWGGTTPAGYDCSGLVFDVWRRLGVVIPRDACDQFEHAQPTRLPRVGDLVFFSRRDRIHHIGIYAGASWFLHAPQTGEVVCFASLNDGRWRTRTPSFRRVQR
jgi:cell wall-associated NlpC family hydrolase